MAVASLALVGCASNGSDGRPVVAVTHSVLGSVVQELVGDRADVRVIISDGADLHTFSPSARDVETMTNAVLVVANGLHLEEGLEDVLDTLPTERVFYAGDHITVRSMDESGSDHLHGEADDHDHGTDDPHFWLSPHAMSEMLDELTAALESALGADLGGSSAALGASLDELDRNITERVAALNGCELVTGHEEMGYFADRYGCEVIGAVIPSSTTSAEASASQLADLKRLVEEHDVKAIFASLGTPSTVAERIADETGVPLVEISTHVMGDDDTYARFMNRFVDTLVGALS